MLASHDSRNLTFNLHDYVYKTRRFSVNIADEFIDVDGVKVNSTCNKNKTQSFRVIWTVL